MMKTLTLCIIMTMLLFTAALNCWELGEPQVPFNPKTYAAPKIDDYIYIDGKITDTEWLQAVWSDYFVDIQGEQMPEPRYKTKIKMMWNDYYLYIAAKMVEPHVWGTLRKRDSVIFHDNDFEVFIDPDGDTKNYFELEINALGTVWDLLLLHPYRDAAQVAIDSWDIQGLQSAVWVDGTLNDHESRDKAWYVELGIPWNVMEEAAGSTPPELGDFWRINFSRVQWKHEIVDGEYKKVEGEKEDNWVWSPQGLINMHYPEMWGYVYFFENLPSRDGKVQGYNSEEQGKWVLRQIYYKMYNYRQKFGAYPSDISEIDISEIKTQGFNMPPVLETTSNMYEIALTRPNSTQVIHIDHKGTTWTTETAEKE